MRLSTFFVLLLFLLFSPWAMAGVSKPAYNLATKTLSCKSIQVTWNRGDGGLSMVTCRPVNKPRVDPMDSIGYSENHIFGYGADLGGMNYCVYVGPDSAMTVVGLEENTAYIFTVYEIDYNPFVYLRGAVPEVQDSTFYLLADIQSTVLNACEARNKVRFTASVTANYAVTDYEWVFTDTTIVSTIAEHRLPVAGDNLVKMQVKPVMGCKMENLSTKVYIVPGVSKGTIKTDSVFCSHQLVPIYADLVFGSAASTSFTRTWIVDDTDVSNTILIKKNYKVPGTHRVQLIIKSLRNNVYSGCSDTLNSSFKVNLAPVFAFQHDTCFQMGSYIVIHSPIKAKRYVWNQVPGTQYHLIADTGYHYLTVRDSIGCPYTDSIMAVYCNPLSARDLAAQKLQIAQFQGGLDFYNPTSTNSSIHIRSIDFKEIGEFTLPAMDHLKLSLTPGVYLFSTPSARYEKVAVY